MTIHWRDLTTAGKIEAIKAVYEPGFSVRKIAASLGVGRNAVGGMYFRYAEDLADCPLTQNKGGRPRGEAKPRKGPSKPKPWDKEKREAVAELLREGMAASKIGAELGVSKHAILGLVRRDQELTEIGLAHRRGRPLGFRPPPRPKVVAVRMPLRDGGVPILALGSHQCRWPVNEAEPGEMHLFCGAATDRSYCPEHHALAYRPSISAGRSSRGVS